MNFNTPAGISRSHYSILRLLLLVFVALCISACGGSSNNEDDDDGGGGTPSNQSPVANAGTDQTVNEQSSVTLNASGSFDSDGSIASYLWAQTAGTAVTLSDNAVVSPSFRAPDIDAVTTLSFELTVTDNEGGTSSATVNVFVNRVADNFVPVSQLEPAMLLNELYFEYAGTLGQKVWVLGFYGNTQNSGDGLGFLVENMQLLESDEQLPHHSYARVDGALPPDDWQGNVVLMYGEIKDYATETGNSAIQPTPLLSVEKYELVSMASSARSAENIFLTPAAKPEEQEKPLPYQAKPLDFNYQAMPPVFAKRAPGVQAKDCDRSVIISGGVDNSNNHSRYVDNVKAKFKKMLELGYTKEHIEVFYNNGGSITLDGTNIVDKKASKADILAHFSKLAEEMPGSCTLTIFVTDHGTGYDPTEKYSGAKMASTQEEIANGLSHPESKMIFDARPKVYQYSANFVYLGKTWYVGKNKDGDVVLYQFVDSEWKFQGSNTTKDSILSETELGGIDINGDGDTTDADYGISIAWLSTQLTDELVYKENYWDSDKDGVSDVRVRWDGERFVVERLHNGEWKEMGRDTNGDYIINSEDGGVDWNLDGDKADEMAFHEGINLWGNEVLWDDEFAAMMKPLAEKGIHNMMEMVSCFSGGFIPNAKDYFENIYTGASEDTPHWNRYDADGKVVATDELTFLDNLSGIDTDSWNAAADAATAADDAAADALGQTRSVHEHEQTQRFSTGTLFDPIGENEYQILLDLPDELVGQIYDFEFILGLQNPRWSDVNFPLGLPAGWQVEDVPGGIRVFSDDPIEDGQNFRILVDGTMLDENVRIEFTDVNHNRLGYTMAEEGDFERPPQHFSFTGAPTACVNHTDHGQSSPSILEWLFAANQLDNSPFTDIELALELTTPIGKVNQTVTLDAVGQLYVLLQIFSYGNYQIEVVGARLVPTDAALQLIGNMTFPFTVTSEETNKGQCTP